MNLQTARLRVTALLAQCGVHAARLAAAKADLLDLGQLNVARLANPSDEEAKRIDLLLFRYMRLQDALGGRLFPALLEAGAELEVESPYIDKLRMLERLGVIESVEMWMELRALRNQMTHDYPDPEIRERILMQALGTVAELQRTLAAAGKYATEKLGLAV